MFDHGAAMNRMAGAIHEQLCQESDELDQLVDVFYESGLTVGGRWHKLSDAHQSFFESPEYGAWLELADKPRINDSMKKKLAAEYEELMTSHVRDYVEQLIPDIEREMAEDAA